MKYLLDTNILVSAALFPVGTAGRAYDLALSTSEPVVICDYTITELRRVFHTKFPQRESSLAAFITGISPGIMIVPTPEVVKDDIDLTVVRDPKDWPIVRAAIAEDIDVIVTGDKDLLEADLPYPLMLTPSGFLNQVQAKLEP